MGLSMGQIGITGGDPDGTGWRTVIGLPIWLWVENPGPSTTGPNSATASVGTVSVTATATLERIEWSMSTPGRVVTTTCSGSNAPGTVYADAYGAQPSPTCGFQAPQVQASGDVTVTGTAYWSIQWAGAGQVGSFGLEPMSQSTQLEVIEVQTLRTEGAESSRRRNTIASTVARRCRAGLPGVVEETPSDAGCPRGSCCC